MYAQERRKVTGKKSNFSRDTQPYIFSNLPFESFELGQFINYIIQLGVILNHTKYFFGLWGVSALNV